MRSTHLHRHIEMSYRHWVFIFMLLLPPPFFFPSHFLLLLSNFLSFFSLSLSNSSFSFLVKLCVCVWVSGHQPSLGLGSSSGSCYLIFIRSYYMITIMNNCNILIFTLYELIYFRKLNIS